MFEFFGHKLARFLQTPTAGYKPLTHTNPTKLAETLRPGDVLLVEGNLRVSTVIKYLTQSSWSHAAVYIGSDNEHDNAFIEADLVHGVHTVPLSKYTELSVRICRLVGLNDEDVQKLIKFLKSKLGMKYDISNTIDLLRYLLPHLPVPIRWRRKMLALGSGDPTRAICSTLIAEAFQSISYPILPNIMDHSEEHIAGTGTKKEIMHIRHYSLFTPRDFDISPYFQIIKPTLEDDFDYRAMHWET